MLGWTFSVAMGLLCYEIIPYLWTGVFEREFTRSLLRIVFLFPSKTAVRNPKRLESTSHGIVEYMLGEMRKKSRGQDAARL